ITLPNARTYNSRYNDFTWFITPGDATEGHYEITLSYMINGEDKPLYKFEFYLLLQSSYEEQQILNGFAYESKPTMNNAMAKSTSTSTDLKYSFFSGLTTEYPTITFDYARYDLTYTHVSGDVQKTIKLDYDERNNQLILSTQIYNDVYQDVYPINTLYKQTSIVTLMFVDSGKYDFNFDYIYRYGDVKKVIPETQIDYAKISLDIYGYQLKYSKAGYTSADMLYLEIYQNGTMFILVNGFTDEGLASGKHSADKTDLGVKYSLITSDEYKTGVIKLDDIQTGGIEGSFNSTEDAINQIDFPKTDMGLWLTLNDNYNLDQSFYCINTAPITSDYVSAVGASSDYINRKDFNKVTTFTTPGYYFVQVSYQYKDENNESKNKIQYFAFQITSVTPTVELYKTREDVYTSEIEYNNFYAHEYTNQNVYANWKETEVFESKIKGKLYFAKGKYISENDLKAVADGANSSNITYNNYEKYTLIKDNGSYLLVLEVGGSLTKIYTYFTIDKENISGLQVYEVATGSVDNKAIYSIKRDENLNYITHTSKGIIDSDFTLSWANKASGANIYASYQFTPFVKKYTSNALSNTIISQTASQTYKYILNEYGVSATSKSISVQKPIALNVALDVNNVLTEQGIYDFTLTDEAGNELKYIVIIDRTEGVVNSTYGEDKTTYISGEMVADYVELEWGTHKAINLDGVSQENNKTIFDLMNGSKIDKYYGEVGNNFNNITNLFMSTGGYNLFVVKNNYTNIKLLPYDSVDNYYRVNSNGVLQVIRANGGIVSGGDEFANRVFENITNAGIKINIDELNGDSYLREYRIDVVGASHIGQGDSGNPFIVRITPDKAMGAVYSASSEGSEFDREVKAHGETTKYVGDNNELYLKEYYDAQASDDGVFVFEWTVPSDTDNFKVTDVRYDYYQLMDQTALDRLNNKTAGEIKAEYMYYPYKWISTTDILKTSDEGDEEVSLYNRTTRAGTDIYRSNVINVGYESYYDENGTLKNSKVTQTGLYIITRTIAINDGGESQISEFSYAFFVDRNAIVAYSLSSVKIVGQFIHVTMPNSDNEVHYSNFTKQGLAKKEQVYINGNKQEKISYTVYLETNKLPAQIKVPTGKYVTGDVNGVDNSSIKATSYQNLKLKLSVYFKDTYGVLPGVNSGAFIKLMNNVVANNDGYIDLKFSNIEN
ncbi:MAG: hypothetical protein J6Q15_00630, partial [Clostridia bacterium]|nr:hypothetical protein [Clostridia bacterium]